MIRLYAHLRGSFRTVSEGLRLAFTELGALDGFYIGEAQDFDADPVGGATSPIAVVVGDPLRCLMAHTQGDHKEIWLLLAPNSEGVPPKLKNELNAMRGKRRTVDGLLAPSTWAQKVLQREFPDLPVELCQHGVLPCFRMYEEIRRAPREQYVALHLTSTNLSRKGTRELIGAWNKAAFPNSKLIIAVNPEYANELRSAENKRIRVVNGQNLEFTALAYLYNQVDLVVQPSRAEGFGLVPLEAMACGVPTAITTCTGHADVLDLGNRNINTPIAHWSLTESDDYWGALAPEVREEDILDALQQAHQQRERHTRQAMGVADHCRDSTWTKGAAGVVAKWKEKHD